MKLNFQSNTNQTGVSLVEMVAFIVIVSIAMVGLMQAYTKILARAPTAAQLTQATQLAQERMELILTQKDLLGFGSTALDPCPTSLATICTTLPAGFDPIEVSGINPLVGWPVDDAATRQIRRRVTVTVKDLQGNTLTEVQSVLTNY